MENKSNLILGVIFILMGAAIFALKYIDFGFNIGVHWPSILGVVGLGFLATYFLTKMEQPGFLFVGSLLLQLGIIFLYSSTNGWRVWPVMSALPAFAVAVSLYLLFLLDKKHPSGFQLAAFVVGIISIIASFVLAMVFNNTLYLSIILILSGLLLGLEVLINLDTRAPAKKKK